MICFSSNHTASFAELEPAHARLVVEAWRHRTADLMAAPGIEQVFCFENRGEEIGVTLTHPHGQIYGYPYLTPRTAVMLGRRANTEYDTAATSLPTCWRAKSPTAAVSSRAPSCSRRSCRSRRAGRWRCTSTRTGSCTTSSSSTSDELDGFAQIYLDVLRRFDRMYSAPLPYISALHQFADTDTQADGYFHVELMSIRRSATKLKYLAASESAMDAFISDVTPESVAQRLRDLG